ncbi:SAM-dependent methyltransferase [Paenibacillus sambharensis]|uniref:SAM-dependent methyltransferase n=1 Tax=Paenibacillus sambharensis TaxID=1803190 RepID=A0A2W1LCL1_9BACL|nr:class I SAM-dependent methyltransferase [Paenibacillus sambharensis]PZD97878.1 SAM-dependent methyltransferase [Paenibacillus sambharensis]
MDHFFDAAVWEQAWKDDTDTASNKMRSNGIDPSRTFDHKAKSFNEQCFSEEGKKRTKRIVSWLEGQGVLFENASVLDIGAASGVFAVPFAERGARVTAVETSPPLIELLKENVSKYGEGQVTIVAEKFEEIDVPARGWSQAFDLVFVSMSPVIHNWDSVLQILQCARKFCYISMPASSAEHSLVEEVWPLVTDQPFYPIHMEMGYLLHLLYLKGYAYETLITRETKTKEVTAEEALHEVMTWLRLHRLPDHEQNRNRIAGYLAEAYPSGKVVIKEGGRFGKVLIRLQDQNMYTREI